MALSSLAVSADLTARGISTTDATVALAVASAAVREAAGCTISQVTATVTVESPEGPLLVLPGPVSAVTSVSVDGTAVTDFTVLPNGLWRACGWGWTSAPVLVAVSYTQGLSDVPADIVDLVCALVAQWNAAKAAGFATEPGLLEQRVDDYMERRSDESTGQASVVWIPERTRRWLAARFGGGATVVEMSA